MILPQVTMKKNRNNGFEGSQTVGGFLQNLVTTKWKEYGLAQFDNTKVEVSSETIWNRVKQSKNLTAFHCGAKSRLSQIENLIVDISINMGKILQTLTVRETIDLPNSFIRGKALQQKLIYWKQIHNPDLPIENMGKIGHGWFQGIKKRHSDRLVTQRGE
jgi:hypothetical protein